jgi:lipoprotein-anchoring transpeptidase ErfK/SrfK
MKILKASHFMTLTFKGKCMVIKLCILFGIFIGLNSGFCNSVDPSQNNHFSGNDVKIEVDTNSQWVQVYVNHALIKEMPCSTGMPDTPTPEGSFKTYEKVPNGSIEKDGKKITYYFISNFNGNIGFHSQITGDHPTVQEGERRFQDRKPSSRGCVRLLISDAEWIYENIGLGASVEIRGGLNSE